MTPVRAREIINNAKKMANHGRWGDCLSKAMTSYERKYLVEFWEAMPKNTCFIDAVIYIANN